MTVNAIPASLMGPGVVALTLNFTGYNKANIILLYTNCGSDGSKCTPTIETVAHSGGSTTSKTIYVRQGSTIGFSKNLSSSGDSADYVSSIRISSLPSGLSLVYFMDYNTGTITSGSSTNGKSGDTVRGFVITASSTNTGNNYSATIECVTVSAYI